MSNNKLLPIIVERLQGKLLKNSIWGILSNIFQNLLFSVFFIIVARKYSSSDFGSYILANTLYGFVLAFSSLGLGQWFIRELMNTENKKELINKFFKIQILAGIIFYIINILLSYGLYENQLIRNLSLLIGINVIFDNIIYVIKFVNIAEFEQQKTFLILSIEALLKLLVAFCLFYFNIPIVFLAVVLILLRFVTLNLFIKIGSSNLINLIQIARTKINLSEIKNIVTSNWPFIVIGSVSVVYWRVGNILVSKILTLKDVADYEISYKLFSIAEILPTIASASVFPMLVKLFKENKKSAYGLYRFSFILYAGYGILSYISIITFSDFFIPFLFGNKYIGTYQYCNEMFLTMLVFPTALLQANVLVALSMEKIDMWLNIASLVINFLFCLIGLDLLKSITIVNYAIFFSFLVFHIIQDAILVREKILTFLHALLFYLYSSIIILLYYFLTSLMNKYYAFAFFGMIIFVLSFVVVVRLYIQKKGMLFFKI